jgi:hypothetical protein
MPILFFGIHKDKDIEEIPSGYLIWLTDQDWFNSKNPGLSNQIVLELEWRTKFDRHFEE